MLKKIKGKRKNKKKGFTLVELIVVLVILAILAALLVPALTGYIKKAKEKSLIAETRQVVIAAQTLVDEKYANGDVNAESTKYELDVDGSDADICKKICELAEVSGKIKSAVIKSGKVTYLGYRNGAGACVYQMSAEEKYTVQDKFPGKGQ